MICKIDHCRSIRLCSYGQTKFVILCPLVTSDSLQSTWIAHFAVLGIVKEFHSAGILAAFPHLVLEAVRTSVKVVRAIVYRKFILLAIKGKLTESNAVGISARNLSSTRTITEIAHRIRISEGYIRKVSVLVRNHHSHDTGTDIRQLDIGSGLIFQSIKVDLFSAG